MKRISLLIILTLALVGCGNNVVAQLNNEGNAAFENADYVAAANSYQAAQVEAPELAEPYYNSGNAFYRQNDFENATLQAHQALRSADEGLAQNTFYNIGNMQFNAAEYEAAIESYKEALRLNPDDQDAKLNLELALRQLEQQQEEQQQQQQQQDQQQQDQQQQDQQQQDQQQQQQQDQQQQPQDQQDQQQQDQQQQDQQQQDQQQQQQQQQNSQNSSDQSQQSQPQETEMTPEQAERLLDAIADESETLQEHLQRIFISHDPPPAQDW